MSVSVRLTRTGRKNAPSYRVVATKTKTKRDGKVLEVLGYCNPSHHPLQLVLKKERLNYWRSVGAIFSKAVTKLEEGKYEYVKYEPKKALAAKEEQAA